MGAMPETPVIPKIIYYINNEDVVQNDMEEEEEIGKRWQLIKMNGMVETDDTKKNFHYLCKYL